MCIFCSFGVPDHEYKLPVESTSDNLWPLDKIYLSKITPTARYKYTLYILASSVISTYDADKRQNSILITPWFHTPAFQFSWNGHDITGKILEQKLATIHSFNVFGGSFFAHPSPEILTKHNMKETSSKGKIWGSFYITKCESSDGG